MPSLELIGIILTGVVSTADLITNVIGFCFKGSCSVRFGEHKLEHKDAESEMLDVIRDQNRRMSAP